MRGVAPDKLIWVGAEEAECWKLTKASLESQEDFAGCLMSTPFRAGVQMKSGQFVPKDVSAKNADYDACRFNAGSSFTHLPNPKTKGQGFSSAYRKICSAVVLDPKTPRYAAIDILLWLTLTDPNLLALNPFTLTARLMKDGKQIARCWKCWSIWGQAALMHGEPKAAVEYFETSAKLATEEEGGFPNGSRFKRRSPEPLLRKKENERAMPLGSRECTGHAAAIESINDVFRGTADGCLQFGR